jgi:signal peptidase I
MINLTSIKERIIYYIDYRKISITQFYKDSGVTYGVLSQKSKISEDNIVRFLTRYNDVNAEWLVTGKGEMLKDDVQPKAYPNKTDDRFVVSEPIENNERKLIPFFDAVTQAGTQAVVNMDAAYPAEMVDAGDFFQDATAIMAVHGESMLPDYKPGSLIAMKEVYNKRLIILGEDYVLETSEYRVIKRIQKDLEDNTCWLACSTNLEIWEQGPLKGRLIHEPFSVPIDEVRRIYLVLGQIHRNHSNKIIHHNSK